MPRGALRLWTRLTKPSLLLGVALPFLVHSAAYSSPPLAELGQLKLPKGKYVITNTETGSSVMLKIDENGKVLGPKSAAAAAAPAAKPATAVQPVQPAQPAQPQPTAEAAGTTGTAATDAKSGTRAMITDKIKREAERAVRRGDVQKLMKKIGIH